jgi:amidohydrolase
MKQAITLFLFLPSFAYAQTNEAALNENIKAIMPKVVEWRRHFHQNPELSNREYKTGAFVADYLKSLGLEVKYPIAKTGVVAILKGRQTRTSHSFASRHGCIAGNRKK